MGITEAAGVRWRFFPGGPGAGGEVAAGGGWLWRGAGTEVTGGELPAGAGRQAKPDRGRDRGDRL
jgi:hypothetical protein